MGRCAQGEAGGNRGRDRGRALREEEDDADGWARAGRGGARALRAAARAGARGGPGRVTQGRPGSGLGRGSGRARWASRDWAAHGVCWAERGRERGPGMSLGCWVGFWVPFLFLFLFYFSLKLNYLNSKEILNSNPYEIKQLKQCISMNASTKLNLRKF